jgi:hypothetical protein
MRNYDVAWYWQDADPSADTLKWEQRFRESGDMAKRLPEGEDPRWEGDKEVVIYNEPLPGEKRVWLLVDYTDRDPDRKNNEAKPKLVGDHLDEYDPTSVTASDDGGQLLYYWELPYQPAFERIKFPSDKYKTLNDNVKDWDLATYCVPEPFSMAFLGTAFLGVVTHRVRKHRKEAKRAA